MAATRELKVLITGDASKLDKSLKQTQSGLDKTKTHAGKLTGAMKLAGGAAAGALIVGLTKSVTAAEKAEVSQRKLETQLRASGTSYKAHAKEIDGVISKVSKLSGLDDEDLKDSFTNIVRVTGDVNKSLKLTGLAADFARAKHMDVAKAGEVVAKVAGGNTGILSRYGIQIDKNATSSEALAALQKKFGGQAEAYGKTTAGSMDRVRVASENVQEVIGAKLLPIVAKIADKFASLLGWLEKHDRASKALLITLGSLAAIFGTIMVVTKVAAAFQVLRGAVLAVNAAMIANPVGVVVAALVALGVGLVIAYKKSETFRKIVDGAFRAVAGAAKWLAGAVVDAFDFIKRLPGRVAGVFNDVKDAIVRRFNAITNGAERIGRGVLNAVVDFVKRLPGRVWDFLVEMVTAIGRAERRGFNAAADVGKKIVSGVIDFVSKLPGRAWDVFEGLLGKIGKLERQGADAALNVGKKIVGGVIDGIGNIGHKILDKIKGGVDWAVDKLKDIGKKLNPFGDGIGRSAGDGIGRTVGASLPSGAGAGDLKGARRAMAPFAAIGSKFGLTVSSGLRPGAITSSGNPSWHSTGEAIDMWDGRGPDSNKLRFFNYMKSAFGGRLAELIYTPGGTGIKDGRPFTYTGKVAADHYDHVHVAFDSGRPGLGDGLGKFDATSYGPPWGGIQGSGTTATGVNLKNAPHTYGIAVDPRVLKLGRNYYVWPNPFGRKGPFRAFDTGGAIKGRRIDFYDWRGRKAQNSWGHRAVTISNDRALNVSSGHGPHGHTGGGKPGLVGTAGSGAAGVGGAPGFNDGQDLEAGPVPTDYLSAASAQAALTPGTGDDLAAAQNTQAYYQGTYQQALATGDPRIIGAAAEALKQAMDAVAALKESIDGLKLVEEQRAQTTQELLDEQKATRRMVEAQGPQLIAGLAAILSGSIAGPVALGFQTPGYAGGGVRY